MRTTIQDKQKLDTFVALSFKALDACVEAIANSYTAKVIISSRHYNVVTLSSAIFGTSSHPLEIHIKSLARASTNDIARFKLLNGTQTLVRYAGMKSVTSGVLSPYKK